MFQYRREQILKANLEEVWSFASNPANLQKITPEYMGFEILTKDLSDKMYAGMIISYKVSPLLGIKMKWTTEITHVEEYRYFIDIQQEGPYRFWHHQHHFKENSNGVLMTDILTYKPPFGFIGSIANSLIIKNKLKHIFDFREKKINEIFR